MTNLPESDALMEDWPVSRRSISGFPDGVGQGDRDRAYAEPRPPNIDKKLDTTTSLTRRGGKPKNCNEFRNRTAEPGPNTHTNISTYYWWRLPQWRFPAYL